MTRRPSNLGLWALAALAALCLWLAFCGPDPAPAQPPPSVTLQQWLTARGYSRTEWVRGDVAGQAPKEFATWHRDVTTSFAARYGLTVEQQQRFFGYSGDTAGQHGDRVMAAQSMFPLLGITPSGPAPWNPSGSLDAFDLSMVSGASLAVLQAGGWVPAPGPEPTPRPPATPAPPAPTPTPPVPAPACERLDPATCPCDSPSATLRALLARLVAWPRDDEGKLRARAPAQWWLVATAEAVARAEAEAATCPCAKPPSTAQLEWWLCEPGKFFGVTGGAP